MEPEKKGVRGFVKEWTDKNPLAVFGLKVAVVAAVGIVATPVVLGAAGLGAGGVIAGSVAAKVQGTIAGLAITGVAGMAFSGSGAAGLPVAAKVKGNDCSRE